MRYKKTGVGARSAHVNNWNQTISNARRVTIFRTPESTLPYYRNRLSQRRRGLCRRN